MTAQEWDSQVLEWSRHYDVIQWTITGISFASTGALFGFCWATEGIPYYVFLFGMALPVLGHIYAASFRNLRRKVHERLNDRRYLELIRANPGYHTWGLAAALHTMLFSGWLALTYDRFPLLRCLLALLASVGYGILLLYFVFADQQPS